MPEDVKKVDNDNEEKETKGKELDLEDLKDVSGGSIRNVVYTKTKPISKDTQKKI